MPHPEKYPLKSLEIGQALIVPETRNMAKYIHKRAEEIGMRFKTRRVGEKRVVQRVA